MQIATLEWKQKELTAETPKKPEETYEAGGRARRNYQPRPCLSVHPNSLERT